MSKKIRKDDKVVVIAGNDKGKTGVVLKSMGERVVVQGVNVRKKHMRPTQDNKGSIVSIERSIHISNIQPCDADGKPVRLKVRGEGENKELFYLDNGKEVLYRSVKKKQKS